MRIRSKLTGGLVTVSDEIGERLITLPVWERADEPAPQPAPKRRRRKVSDSEE